jgi:DNA-binding CsgD family transcriptional regulator
VLQEPNNQKKLTDREVKEIRNLARTSDLTQREIADCYDINSATVSRIVRGVYHK